MALAYIRYEESDGVNRKFQIDLGQNRYYAYAIGTGEPVRRNGVPLLDAPEYESPILGPLESGDGRGELDVPENRFGSESRFIQLQSFRTRAGEGPAVSPIVETDPGEGRGRHFRRKSMATSLAMTAEPAVRRSPAVPASIPRPRRRKCRISESKALSTAQFIDTLVSLLPQLLPAAGGIISSLFGGGAAPAPGTTSAPRATPAQPAPAAPAWLNQLVNFVQQLVSQSGRPAAPAPQPAARPAPASPNPAAPGILSVSKSRYSEPMAVPLLAALPAVMPLLQQVLSPQTIQSVLQTADPNKLIGTISNAINSFAQLGLQNSEAERAHLRALNPGVDDPALMQLLAQLSTNLEEVHHSRPRYRRTEKARLHFAETGTVTFGGKAVVAYMPDQGLRFPLSLETAKPVPPGRLRVAIRHAETLDRVARFHAETPPLSEGRVAIVPSFQAEELNALRPGHDYLVEAELVWQNRSGQRLGTSTTQTIRIAGQFTFDSVREGNEIVPLNDVDKFRDFWHKIWQDSFSKEVARREYECKYYYLLKPELTSNEQTQTDVREQEKGVRKITGRMRTGLLLSPNRLNELLPQLGRPQLRETELKALLDPRFVERMSLAARYHAKFAGPPDRPAALWVFPEMKIQRVLLRKADRIEDSGHVLSFSDHEVRFPVPVLAHFVGVEGE